MIAGTSASSTLRQSSPRHGEVHEARAADLDAVRDRCRPGFRCRSRGARAGFRTPRRPRPAAPSSPAAASPGTARPASARSHCRRMRQHCFISCIFTQYRSQQSPSVPIRAVADADVELQLGRKCCTAGRGAGRAGCRCRGSSGRDRAYSIASSFETTPTLAVRLTKMWLKREQVVVLVDLRLEVVEELGQLLEELRRQVPRRRRRR